MDLRLKIQKSTLAITISILEKICMPIFRQNKRLRLFQPKFAQNGFWVLNSKNRCHYKNQNLQDTLRANFQQKWIPFVPIFKEK